MRPLVIGIDGGGTHTRGVLLSLTGEVLSRESTGPSNYMAVGVRAAKEALELLISRLNAVARAQNGEVVAAGFGLAGLDRPKDQVLLLGVLAQAGAASWPYVLLNDAFLALRAGTLDGVGIAAVSGTGCNTVGVDARGRHERVGGLAYEFGDFGGGNDLGIAALRAAFRGEDGRGQATALTERVRRELGVQRLDDVMDRTFPDAAAPFVPGTLAPALFEVAEEGDPVARGILELAGRELGLAARIVAERLFQHAESFPLALGGSVLARGGCGVLREALVAEVQRQFPKVRPLRLETEPVLGAALLAIDRLAQVGHAAAPACWPDAAVMQKAQKALAVERAE